MSTLPLEGLVGRLRSAGRDRAGRSLEWRREQLRGIVALLDEQEPRLVAALDDDLGRPHMYSFLGDIAPPRTEARHALTNLERWMQPTRASLPIAHQPGRAWSVPEPKGVVLVMAPWNYPVQLCLSPAVSALAAGNSVVIKPSELAPATSRVLAELIPRYLDPDGVAVVEGDQDVATALLAIEFDHILFTGSTAVGRHVMRAAAEHLTPVTLELGGKSPVIVAADADLEVAVRRIVFAKGANAGQTCIAPDYVLVDDSVRPQFVELLVDEVERVAGHPDDTKIISERHLKRLAELLSDHGGHVAVDGGPDPATQQFAPVVITDPDPTSPLMTEEIFGPILPVVAVESVDAAIDFVNRRPKPLALYLFSRSRGTEARVLTHTSSGQVCVNHLMYQALVPSLPFGGVGPAGTGSYHGQAGFETFSHRKAVLRKPTRPDLKLAYPPYGRAADRMFRTLIR